MKEVKLSLSYVHHFCLSLINSGAMKTMEDFDVAKTGVSNVNSISRAHEVLRAAK